MSTTPKAPHTPQVAMRDPGRRIAFGGFEHQQREIYAAHVHSHNDEGTLVDYGNGGTSVMRVLKDRRNRRASVVVYDADTGSLWGQEFVYADYFLPEELAARAVLAKIAP